MKGDYKTKLNNIYKIFSNILILYTKYYLNSMIYLLNFFHKVTDHLVEAEGLPPSIGITLRDKSFDLLRNAMLDRRYRTGEKSIKRDLCEFTGASRSVLRVVLASLVAKGSVESQFYRGYSISVPSKQKNLEIFALGMSLETFAAELFVERASEQEILAIKLAYEQLEDCVVQYNTATMRGVKEHFYDVIFISFRDPEIRNVLSNVVDVVYHLRGLSVQSPDRRASLVDEMWLLATGLVERGREGANKASRAHLKSARDALLAQVRSDKNMAQLRNIKVYNGG